MCFVASRLECTSFLLTGLLLIPLGSSFVSLLGQARKDNTRDIVQRTIQRFLTKETLTFGDPESVDVERVEMPGIKMPPVILVVVRVAIPIVPRSKKCRWCRRKSTAANRFASGWWFNAPGMSLAWKKNPTKTAKRASC